MADESDKGLNKLEELERKREHILQMGGQRRLKQRHKKGQMSARERIDYFFDPGTFTEIGLFVKHRTTAFGMDQREVPAEGVITGFGKVNGRHVVAAAEDYTAMAGTFGEYHGKKFVRAVEFAKDNGWPFVGMNDSGGARLQEGNRYSGKLRMAVQVSNTCSGIIPQIALLMGPCLGGQAYHPVMQDFLIQTKHTDLWALLALLLLKRKPGRKSASRNFPATKPMPSNQGKHTSWLKTMQIAWISARNFCPFCLPATERNHLVSQRTMTQKKEDLLSLLPEHHTNLSICTKLSEK